MDNHSNDTPKNFFLTVLLLLARDFKIRKLKFGNFTLVKFTQFFILALQLKVFETVKLDTKTDPCYRMIQACFHSDACFRYRKLQSFSSLLEVSEKTFGMTNDTSNADVKTYPMKYTSIPKQILMLLVLLPLCFHP